MKDVIYKVLSAIPLSLMAVSVLFFSGAVLSVTEEGKREFTPSQCATVMNLKSHMKIPEKPGPGNFVAMQAKVQGIESKHLNRIDKQLQKLLEDKATSVYVVTINAYAQQICPGYPYIERYAERLFQEWNLNIDDSSANILFLVAGSDSQIKLSDSFEDKHKDSIKAILNTLVIPNVSDNQGVLAVLDGVDGLDAMIRGESLPGKSIPSDRIIYTVAIVVFILFLLCILIFAIKTWDKNREYGGSPGFDLGSGDGGG